MQKSDISDYDDGRRDEREADYAITVLSRIIAWGYNRGLCLVNSITKTGKLYKSDRRECIWSTEDENIFLKTPLFIFI